MRRPNIVANPLSEKLQKLVGTLRRHASDIKSAEQRQDFVAAANRLESLARGIDDWLGQRIPESVYWIDRSISRNRRRITLAAAPIDVGPTLREHLFAKVPTVVMTSATLATGGDSPSFAFFASRVGLSCTPHAPRADSQRTPHTPCADAGGTRRVPDTAEDSPFFQTETLWLGSPFDYRNQAELILPSGMPDPGEDAAGYERATIEMIRRYVARSDGQALCYSRVTS